jgi:RNA polymerase sigma-70 factor (ECF subfamily)
MMDNEQQLIAQARQGDREALNALVTRNWPAVYRLVLARIGSGEDAQEITQETFIKAFRALPGYRETGAAFSTYLGRIALNLVNDFWRKKGRSPQVYDIAEYQEPLVDIAPSPEEQAVTREKRQEIAAVIAMLPPDQRQAVELRIIAGLSVQQTAQKMAKTEAAVKMLQQRALKTLRKLMEEKGIL